MFNHVGWGEIAVLLVLGLFVFGPERLPQVAADAGRMLRKVRLAVKGMTDDLKTELGPEMANVDLASLHPKAFVQKHLLDDLDDDRAFSTSERGSGSPLRPGEPAPWDPDAT